ncbi:hypothetical protein KR084_007338 [Drosophila pseudotakahashii]|nr:hypothetical protein KR084_007338 [Drosophila pseudotakahashii]
MDPNHEDLDDLGMGAMKALIKKAKKTAALKSNQFKREMKQSEDELIAMQDPMHQEIMKNVFELQRSIVDEDFEAHKRKKQLEYPGNHYDDDSNSDMEECQAEIAKHDLKNKYENALKDDEKLQAEVEHSVNGPSPDTQEHLADLKQRHKDQAEVYKKVQEKLISSFKKDMDKLMCKFDAAYSRLRKDHFEFMAETKEEHERDCANAASTHQP